jgi:hypothetical protein
MALVLALLMPFFTISAQSVVPAPVKVVTSMTDAIPQEPLADLFVGVALLALVVAVVRMLRPVSGPPMTLLALASFASAAVLVAVLQLQWNDTTSRWQADGARFLGVDFSHSFGFWVYLGAGVAGGGLVVTELVPRLIGRPASAVDSGRAPLSDASSHLPPRASGAAVAAASSTSVPAGPVHVQPIAPTVGPPAGVMAAAAGAGRVVVVESGRSTAVVVGLGQSVFLGRDAGCAIRLSDPRASRRPALIERMTGGWVVRDLGATNPTRLLQASGTAREVGPGVRVVSGQLLVGDVLVTLYP